MPYNIITHDSIIVNRRRKIKSRSAPPNGGALPLGADFASAGATALAFWPEYAL